MSIEIDPNNNGRGFGKGNPESNHMYLEDREISNMPVEEVGERLYISQVAKDFDTTTRIVALKSSIAPKLLSIGEAVGSKDHDKVFMICHAIAKDNLQFLPQELREEGSIATDKKRAAYIYACAKAMSESM